MAQKHTIDVIKEILEIQSPASIELSSWLAIDGTWDNPRERHHLSVTTPDETVEKIRQIYRAVQSKNPPWDLGICSNITMRGGEKMHTPQIDFRAKAEENGRIACREKILSVISHNGKAFPGYLICSGQSYHYIGLRLLTLKEWLDFLGLCLLCEDGGDKNRFSPVDRLWVGHRLRQQQGVLRIFASQTRPEPFVVERYNSKYEFIS